MNLLAIDHTSQCMRAKTYHKVLTIAGSDSGGGAGIQADLKTFSALGCYGMSVITALTAQNTMGVAGVHPVPPAFVEKQLEAVFSDIGADAVKIGMLYSTQLVDVVSRQLKKHQAKNVVLDPVMAAQSKDALVHDDTVIESIKERLMPLTTVLTPNLPEASVFLNRQVKKLDDMRGAAMDLAHFGSKNILLKGGHLKGNDTSDLLFISGEDRFVLLQGNRIDTQNNHGTGCTLSSAIAAFLAKGLSIEKSAGLAKEFILGAIRAGAEYNTGHGHGPLHHFYKFWK